MGRTKYDRTAAISAFDVSLAGTFGEMDLELTYDSIIPPLTITNPPTSLSSGMSATITWTGGDTNANVEILFAVNTMIQKTTPNFDDDIQELNWVSAGSVTNRDGQATVTVPELWSNGNNVNLMIRSGSSQCYYFDLAPEVLYTDPPPTPPTPAPPTPAPNSLPPCDTIGSNKAVCEGRSDCTWTQTGNGKNKGYCGDSNGGGDGEPTDPPVTCTPVENAGGFKDPCDFNEECQSCDCSLSKNWCK